MRRNSISFILFAAFIVMTIGCSKKAVIEEEAMTWDPSKASWATYETKGGSDSKDMKASTGTQETKVPASKEDARAGQAGTSGKESKVDDKASKAQQAAGEKAEKMARVDSGVESKLDKIKSEPVSEPKAEKMTRVEPSAEKMAKSEPLTDSKSAADAKAQKDELARIVEKEGRLYTVYYDFDKFFIRDDMKSFLEKNADWLKKNSAVKVQIEGNCDERGSDEYNMALGDRRAESAKKYLTNLGIDSNRISTISYGEEKPLCRESDESCWSKNRRSDFVVK